MYSIGIVSDSHSSITQEEAQKLGIYILPMPFTINEKTYYEDSSLSRTDFFKLLEEGADVKTSQPTPIELMRIWDLALEKYEEILYIPISSGLSGSCMSAMALAENETYKGRVYVVDNGRVSALLHRSILDALELIKENYSAAEIKEILEASRDKMTIYIGVNDLEYLKRGGRIKAVTEKIASLLNIKPILKFDVGILESFKNCRGYVKMRKAMIEALKNDLETTFKSYEEAGEVALLVASSSSAEVTQSWLEEVKAAFPNREVMCDDLSLGVCCHIGPGGLGIGCSCKPKRL